MRYKRALLCNLPSKWYNLSMRGFANLGKVILLLVFAVVLWQRAGAALPKFMGGSGLGISGNKANLEGKYPTFWDNLMESQAYTNMYQGLRALSMSKYKEAEQAFAKAVIKNPADTYGHTFLGIALYWQGQVEQAMAEYRTALKLDPDNAEAYQLLGIAYAWEGNIDAALESFKKAVELAPERPDSQMNLGSTYAALGNYDEALFHFRNAVRLDKTHPLYHYQLGSLYEVMGWDKQAEDSFKKALHLYPSYEEDILALAVLYEKQNSLTNAEVNYKKALKIKPGDSVARFRLANLLIKQGKKEGALSLISRGFLISPLSDEGLALSVSYGGSPAEPMPPAPQKKSNGKKQNKGKNDLANQPLPLPVKPFPAADKQLESFKKRLQRIPANKTVNIDLEIRLEPKLKPSDIKENTVNETDNKAVRQKSLLQASVEAAGKESMVKSFSRSFSIRPSGEEERKEFLNRIFRGLNEALENASKDYNVKLSIRGGSAVADSSSLKNNAAASNSKAQYNPYMVGNDMGLWVAGKGWVKYVQEVLPEAEARLKNGDGVDYMLYGLAALTLGEGKEALEAFTSAYMQGFAREDKTMQENSLLGRGTAYIILGLEDEALKQYEAVLSLNPENKIALENKKILTDEE